ncbi:MAG: nucleotidyltransferase domain-containing protein [Bernardetiaceae bacterium]|nr:nucleotidyltransferase domain-containing protein [Bernardetiaceae bacterium]
MQKISDNHWLKQLKKELQNIEPTAELILYGSRARGTAQKDSDWDLLLLTDKSKLSHAEESQLRLPVFLQELELAEVLSLHIFNKKEWHNKFSITPFYENIQKEGVKI